jgi:phage/conjugal plasmid C-4 type zinc finger TraR family protein
MPDIFDHASGIEAQFTQMALEQQLATTARAQNTNAHSEKYCLECGEEIPAARRAAQQNVTLCIECAADAEKRARLTR